MSPENVSHCFHLTQVKDSLSVLTKMAGGNEEFLASLVSGSAAADNGTNSSSSTGVEPAPPNGSTKHNDEDAMISVLVSVF